MGTKKPKKSKSKGVKGAIGKAKGAIASVLGKSSGGGGGRRKRGPTYWANKVLVEKLKKRYNRLKYGGMR